MGKVYNMVMKYKNKYPGAISFRLKKHCKLVESHLYPDEEVIYAFCAQKNDEWYDISNTNVICLTNKRMIVATKRVLFGYFFISVVPNHFNDLTIFNGLIWGKILIDTVKEEVLLTNIPVKAMHELDIRLTDYFNKYKRIKVDNENRSI